MIFSMIFLFLILLCSAAVIYYLYAFFIPALKLKNKEYNNLLASDFDFDDDFREKSVYNVLSPEERENDRLFNLKYRSEVNDEKICIKFDENSEIFENSEDNGSENDFIYDEKNLEKKTDKSSKGFKFWIYCYKLLERK